ncbi:MAG: phage terminase large subunit family protein [Beijerinckiaceae bacterium]|nr:phage terminase large subunit family protein [Beijerinckiaceae bacterium]
MPRSDPSSVDAFAFEGADELWRSWRDGLTPDPLLTVSEWADRHRFLSPRASAEPGRYRTDRTPYMRAIMDALSPSHPVRRIVFMKAAQVGATEAGNNWIGYVIHHAPGPMLSVQPTVELAKRFSRQRIEPLIAESPSLRERVKPSRARDAGNTVLSKEFPAGLLVITGANSAVGLRSMPARYLFLDEVDAYPPSADEEGDPVALAEARTRTFSWRSKVFLASTPTIHGVSRIEREFEASDQQRFFVPCPHCQHRQWLRFERLRWDKGKPETAHYICDACDTPIEEHHKIAMLEDGEWRATAEATDPGTIGFHLSALYSPVGWMSWAMIARMWETSQSSDEAKRSFKNSVLGETRIETGDAPDWLRIYERREDWQIGTVPSGGLFLTAGADVQKDRIEVSIWAWGRDLTSWLVDHIVIDGGPDNPECWSELGSLLDRTWPHAHGARLGLAKLGIDTGYEAAAVYSWARAMGHAQVAPLKGVEGFNRAAPIVGPTFVDVTEGGKRLCRGARLWTVAVATFKSETYRYLRLARPTDEDILTGARHPAGYVHLPRGLEAEWIKQLVAEQLISVKTRRGFQKLEWQKLRERNEVLDCRVYARAAAWIAGADRWTDEKWRDLEDQVGPMPEQTLDLKPDAPIAAGVLARAPAIGGKRRSDWLSGVDKGWLR